jgi:TonB-dependent SusC/RagA subfamily outer membrane receptor
MKNIIAFTMMMGFSLAGFAQKADSTKTTKITLRGVPSSNTNPLIVIDGNIQYIRGSSSLNEVDPNNIESVAILKDSLATAKYGADGFAGVIEVKTKNGSLSNSELKTAPIKPVDLNLNGKIGIGVRPVNQPIIRRYLLKRDFDTKAKPLYIIDGKEADGIENIDKESIKSISVIKDAATNLEYGDKGKNGVIIITTKKATPKKN